MFSFARIIGVTDVAISNYENSKRRPRLDIAYKILDLAKKHHYSMNIEDIYQRPSSKSKA